jgi:hypothetical protein
MTVTNTELGAYINAQTEDTTPDAAADFVVTYDASAAGTKKVKLDKIGGGGGNVTYESAYASPPATPASGDLWYISDGLLHARYNGSAWQYYYGTQQVTKPVLSDFGTWFNQGSTTVDDYGHLNIYTPASASGYITGKIKNAPSLNYTIDALIIPTLWAANYMHCGLCWSDGTKFATFGFCYNGGWTLEAHKFNTATSYSAQYGSNYNYSFYPDVLWLRIQEDSSNRTWSFSRDRGKHFTQVGQIGRTDFLTATKVGFFLYYANGTYAPMMNLLSWKQS